MRSCPPSSQSQPLIVSSSSLSAYSVRGKGYASLTSSTARSAFRVGHLSNQEVCDSWLDSTFGNITKDNGNPKPFKRYDGKYLHQLHSHLRRVRLVSSCVPACETSSQGHFNPIKELSLESLKIRGLRVKKNNNSSSLHFTKEDSENRARRFLVKVDQHLGVHSGGERQVFLPRYKEALRIPENRSIKGNNNRVPVDTQRDQPFFRSSRHRKGKNISNNNNNKPRQKARPQQYRISNASQNSSPSKCDPKTSDYIKSPENENASAKTVIPADGIPSITIEGFPLDESGACSQSNSPQLREKKLSELDLEDENIILDNRNSFPNDYRPLDGIYKQGDSEVFFAVTVRTQQREQLEEEIQQPQSQESSKQLGTQEPYRGVLSSAHVSLLTTLTSTTTIGTSPSTTSCNATTTSPGRATCRIVTPPRSSQLQAGRRHVVKHHRSDPAYTRYITSRSGLVPQSATQHRIGQWHAPSESKALAVQQFQLHLPLNKERDYSSESSVYKNQQWLSPGSANSECVTSSLIPLSDFKLGLPTQHPSEMANETETQQNMANSQVNGQVKHVKGYRKKGLVSEKVLLERLSDMSIEDDLLNPVITLSSVEDDDDSPMEEGSPKPNMKGTLKKSLSLAVPSLNLAEEPKRPPL